MKKLWSKHFFSEVLSLLPFEKGVIVGTTFGATYINLKGSKELSWKLGRGVTSACFLGNELVLGTGFPGSLVFLEGTRISRVLRTKGSVNCMMEHERDLIAGTGFLKKAFSEGMYLSKYVHFKEGWEKHREEVEGMIYRVTRDLDLLWKRPVPGIVVSLQKVSENEALIHAVYDVLQLMELKNGEILKTLRINEPIRKVKVVKREKVIYALTTKSLIKYDFELEEIGREEGSNFTSIATNEEFLAIGSKNGKIAIRREGRTEEYLLEGKVEDMSIVNRTIFGIVEKKKAHFAFEIRGEEISEHQLKGEPIGLSGFDNRIYLGTRGRVYCFELRKKYRK